LAVWAFALDTTAAGTKVQGVPGVLADPAQFQRRSEPAASIAGNWRLTGNAGTNSTNFLGTTDGQPLNFRVNDQRALRLEPNSQSPNVIGGSGVNVAEAGTVGSTIGGGGMANLPNVVSGVLATIGGGGDNRVENTAATIAGGIDNRATGGQATVGGGIANAASADRATVGGGRQNRATGEGATIPGGAFNLALGSFSFAAGYRAHAGDAGSFVWGDSTNEDVSSTGPDQFVVRARGGLHLRDGQLFCDGCVTVDDLAPGTTQGLRPYCALVRAHPMSYEGAPCLHHSETVDGFTGNTSIAIGTDGNPVISYHVSSVLRVTRCRDPLCLTSVQNDVDTGGAHNSIAIAPDGNPVIAYPQPGGSLSLALCGDPNCATHAPLTLDFGQNLYPSVAIGADGNPVVSYSVLNGALKVAHCSDPDCGAKTVQTLDAAGAHTSLAIGIDGNPVVSYQGGGSLRIAHCDDPACQTSSLRTLDAGGTSTSIAIGTDGNPVVSYTGAGGTLKVAHCEDPSCTSSTTQPLATTSDYTSIAIGTDGNPVVGYTEAGSALKFARCGDRACAASTLQSLDARGITPSVAVGPDGNPVISYSGPGSTLKVARPATLS
jgi:hypothetical protein